VLLAELEVYNSRPIAPTRRVALGTTVLPTSPAPGFGGLLLGGIVAAFVADVDPDLLDDLARLVNQVEAGQRVAQPRLRHRLQEDRVGLTCFRHRLIGDGERLRFEIDRGGSPTPQVLGAVYAAGRVPAEHRSGVCTALRRALGWRGEVGPRLVAHLSDSRETAHWVTVGGRDPVLWALEVLGLADGAPRSSAEGTDADPALVQRRFRELLRLAHPDHGGEAEAAAARIAELTEARRILLGRGR
jgi:hypothetical protein